MGKEEKIPKRIFLPLILLFITSCDFTPRLSKDVLAAQEYIQNHEYEKAASRYETILKESLTPEMRLKINYQLAELYSTYINNQSKALYFYTQVKKEADDPLWVVKSEEKMGEINFSYLGNYLAAVDSYLRLTQFEPRLNRYDFYRYRLGVSYINAGKYPEAIDVFEKIQKDVNGEYYAKTYYFIGMVYFQQKEWLKAIAFWREYLKIEKRLDQIVDAKFFMANAYEMLEELKIAYDIYYSILSTYPYPEVIQSRLNSIYQRRLARKR